MGHLTVATEGGTAESACSCTRADDPCLFSAVDVPIGLAAEGVIFVADGVAAALVLAAGCAIWNKAVARAGTVPVFAAGGADIPRNALAVGVP